MQVCSESESMVYHIQPGNDFPERKAWRDAMGYPVMYSIAFKQHVADVAEDIGQYMIDKGLAYKSLADLPTRLVHPSVSFMRDVSSGVVRA